jgi:hypothetical protein
MIVNLNLNRLKAVTIANPMYDTVFNRLMKDTTCSTTILQRIKQMKSKLLS